MTNFLEAFKSAADKPIVQLVVWPKTIPDDHPIRQVKVGVRFWPAAVTSIIEFAIAADDAQSEEFWEQQTSERWHVRLFWYIIAATASDPEGRPFFRDNPDDDFETVAASLKASYASLQGMLLMSPLWDQCLSYNGFGKNIAVEEATKGKN